MSDTDQLFERWAEVDSIFREVLALHHAERIDHVREACGDDAELFGLVSGLLDAMNEQDGLLDNRDGIIGALTLEEEADNEDEGLQAGAFRLVSQIGRGGTGTVYRARRVDGGFEQEVAIKLLRRGLDTNDLLQRFRGERQILASLDHAGIARLIDGGATADGRPYLVLELVNGKPITEHCAASRLTIEQRLQLFMDVGRVVSYAHRSLVVHRDLKPSNILVTPDGTVKLLDFGIAKLLDSSGSPEQDAATRTGMRLLTPEYASPEQLRGEPITTASDVYQLGILLCQLLTGTRPGRGVPESLAEPERATAHHRFRMPSAIVMRGAESRKGSQGESVAEVFAAGCRSDPRRLARRLRGDLDTIVTKALREEPGRRYASVDDMVADVQRHLSGEPVRARKDSLDYRVRKYVRRHPGWAVAMAIALLATSAYLVTLSQHARRLDQERGRAVLESEKARSLAEFLISLFEASDPDYAEGRTLSALDLLSRGEANASQLDGRPVLKAQTLTVIGELYNKLGAYDDASPLLHESLALQRALNAPPDADLGRTLISLGHALSRSGKAELAEPLFREAIEIARAIGDSALQADGHSSLGDALHRRGNHRSAEPMYRRAMELSVATFGERHERTADALHALAFSLHMQGRIDEAEPIMTRALALKREVLGAGHSSITKTLTALGRLHSWKGDQELAEPLLREAVQATRERLGERHPLTASALGELGNVLTRRGDNAGAEKVFRDQLEIILATSGASHVNAGNTMSNLSWVLAEQGHVSEAIPLRRTALEGTRQRWGAAHPNTAMQGHYLGLLLEESRDAHGALVVFGDALDAMERSRERGERLTLKQLIIYGDLLLRADRAAEAEPLLRETVARSQSLGDGVRVAEATSLLGACLATLGRESEGAELLESSYRSLDASLGGESSLTRAALGRLERYRRNANDG